MFLKDGEMWMFVVLYGATQKQAIHYSYIPYVLYFKLAIGPFCVEFCGPFSPLSSRVGALTKSNPGLHTASLWPAGAPDGGERNWLD